MANLKRIEAGVAIGAALAGAGLAFAPFAASAQAAGNPANGQAQYQAKCGGCHSLEANRIGPAHRGVVGRRIATAPGYAYSPALKKLTGVWTPARIDLWLQGPQKLAPGSKMFLTVPDVTQRRDIIAYLTANPSSGRR
jgi:cytochrome c